MIIHIVQPGETVYSIARIYGVPPSRIISDNEIKDPENLAVGQTLVILIPNRVHTVREGETLNQIAARYGTTTLQLLRNNPNLEGVPLIYPGQSIIIDYSQVRRGDIEVNGYAYTFIDRTVLRKTLPYLTYLTVFTYGFREDGSLIVPDDMPLVEAAREYSVKPIMLISTLGDDGKFSNEKSSLLLSDTELQDVLIKNIIENMKQKGYYGLDIDFEYVFAADRQKYVDFVGRVKAALEPEGYKLIVSLAPKTASDQPGLLYEGHDYAGLGANADYVLLMTYEWGYLYSPPMAIAPIDKVEEVVAYAATQISPDKIFMGMPNYGYDWKLPFVRGESKAEGISNADAVALAANENAEIMFDTTAQSPFFNYTRDGSAHEVWFEDARSVESKLALAEEYRLNGVSFWNIMKYFPQSWLVLNSLYNITTLG